MPMYPGPSAAGLTNFTDAINTASPNATIPVVSLTATNAATNVDAAIVTKGTGNIASRVADGATAGGNKRGVYAADFQQQRTAATQVASGLNSALLGGGSNTASGGYSAVIGGVNATASGSGAVTLGGDGGIASGQYATCLGGETVTASGNYSVASGRNSIADGPLSTASGQGSDVRGVRGARAHAALAVTGGSGSSQTRNFVLCRQTTTATPTVLTADNGAASSGTVLVLINNSLVAFEILVSAKAATYGDRAAYKITGVISRNASAASTVIDGTPTVTTLASIGGASAWAVAVSADTTLGGLAITVTGAAATSIYWFATMDTAEVGS